MKLIIAGGRNYWLTIEEFKELDRLHFKRGVKEVLCGCATGADSCGKVWAILNRIPVRDFPPDWDQHGKRAGILRNIEMAKHATALAIFPGGTGTRHMLDTARSAGLEVFNFFT